MGKKSATNPQASEPVDRGVGVRDLRDHLSRHLSTVKQGGEVTVTEHGKPIARLVPYNEPTQIEKMIAEGRITPPKQPVDMSEPLPEPIRVSGKPLSEIVIEMRR